MKEKWSNEKLHLENARKFRRICFIDAEDGEFKETIKNAREKLETPIAPAVHRKIMKENCGSGASKKNKDKTCVYSGSWWNHKNAYGKFDTASSWRPYCRKGWQFTTALELGSQVFPMPQAIKNPAAKAAVDKEWEKIGGNFGVALDESQK